jgi:hypothetical protein
MFIETPDFFFYHDFKNLVFTAEVTVKRRRLNPHRAGKFRHGKAIAKGQTITVQQACFLNRYDDLPEYAKEALAIPFIRYEPAERCYNLHSILSDLLTRKREEQGPAFERECLLRAGDFCRDNGISDKALGFYAQSKDYERMLSLNLSELTLETVGKVPFSAYALDIAANCPVEIKRRNILSMLRVAWALLTYGSNEAFDTLMNKIRGMLTLDGTEDQMLLLGEWELLASFTAHPHLDKMTAAVTHAAGYFNGKSSQIILPTSPWCFGDYSPLAVFHIKPGEADREADALEAYLAVYSKLTNGSGTGADAVRAQAKSIAESQQKRMFATGQEWTLPQWVDVHLQTMEEHLAAMKKIKPALDALYQALTPEQRQKADQLIRVR